MSHVLMYKKCKSEPQNIITIGHKTCAGSAISTRRNAEATNQRRGSK